MNGLLRSRLGLIAAALWVGLGAVFFGVGGDDPSRVFLYGTVKVDGQPLDRGTIQFFRIPQSPDPVSAGAIIDQGRFSLCELDSLVPGTYLVKISGLGLEGLAVAAGAEAESLSLKEPLPERYNRKSEIEVVIPHEGTRQLHFDLKR
jgi:hypothetical protein